MKKFSTFLGFLVLLISVPVLASETPWQSTKNNEGSIQLISAGYTTPDKILSGIHIKFKDHWKTYWKVVGDSGMPVTPDFSGSTNVRSSEMLWPVPERHLFFDLEGWGYENEIILPVITEVKDPSQNVNVDVNVKWAVCNEDCIFAENKLSLKIAPNDNDAETEKLIDNYFDQVPQKIIGDNSEVKLENITATDKSLTAEFSGIQEFSKDIDLFIYDDTKNFRYPKPEITVSEDRKNVKIKTNYEILKSGETLSNKVLNLVLRNGKTGYETSYKVDTLITVPTETSPAIANQIPQQPVSQIVNITLMQAIIAALIGGLILNIMPCVLPVLSIKIIGVIKHGASDKAFIRKSFSYTIAGIIFSFILLAVFVTALKFAGHSVGWGIQFQQPIFLILLSVLLTLFAANQFGWFEVNLSSKLSNQLNQKIDDAGASTPLGNFLTGAFATILATPCTAPFVTTAISFAFASDIATLFLIFIFMGIGLSIPYILILISPSLVKIFPKPGRWMRWVKVILGILLFLTNLWIFWIFFTIGKPNAGFVLFFCSLLLFAWLGAARLFRLNKTKVLVMTVYTIIVTFGMTLYVLSLDKIPENMKDAWVPFSEDAIDQYVDDGKVVFLDVTAEWCLTCKFNKAHVTYPLKSYFDERGVILMKADYTVPNKVINDFLTKNHIYGIPYNKVYGPNARDGIQLPEILTEASVKDAVEAAKKK